MIASIGQDLAANRGNTKGKIILLLFRTANLIVARRVTKYLFFPYLVFYKLFVEWFLGVELPWGTRVGAGCCIFHGQATVIHRRVTIGRNCVIRQSTTMGNAREDGGCPVIGDHVNIGSNVCIIGEVTIGDHVTIGAGSVVTRDIPAYSVAVGNPARVIKNQNSSLCAIPVSLLPVQASM